MRAALLPCILAAAGPAVAQSLGLATSATDQARNHLTAYDGNSHLVNVPLGPVSFPLALVAPPPSFSLSYASLGLTESASAPTRDLFMREDARGIGSLYGGGVICHLVTRVTMPLPARVPMTISCSITQAPWSIGPASALGRVDIEGDGVVEFALAYAGSSAQSTAVHDLLVDSRGVPIEWEARTDASGGGTFGTSLGTLLQLSFTEPVQEPAYGPTCEGELGCQLVPNAPFARVLVASLPGVSSMAWLLGGDQQVNVPIPGVACPLLCNPLVVLPVPLQPGSNGRAMIQLDAVFPPLPGMVWFVQGVALANGAFAGTNGVRIQT